MPHAERRAQVRRANGVQHDRRRTPGVNCRVGLCIPDFTKEMPSLPFAKAASSFPVFLLTRTLAERALKLSSGDTPFVGNRFQTIPHSTLSANPASCYYVSCIPRSADAENAL